MLADFREASRVLELVGSVLALQRFVRINQTAE